MHYRQLGKSDLYVSSLSFGCMSLKGTHTENAVMLHQAQEAGINFFDTADLYDKGENEVTVGRAFKTNRAKVVIASKVGNQWRPDGSGWDWNPTKEYILQAADQSLRRLQTDYLDLYQLHGGTLEDPIDETIEAFEILKQQGKIRYYGISSIRPNVIRRFVDKGNLTSVMIQYSLLDRRPEEEMLSLIEAHSVGVLARGSLAQGLLAGKNPKPYLSLSEEEVKKALDTLATASSPMYKDKTHAAMAYVLAQPAITTAVLGIRTPDHLQQALAPEIQIPMSPDILHAVRRCLPAQVYAQHR